MGKTLIDIQNEIIAKLDVIAAQRKVSRASLIRMAIDAWLDKQKEPSSSEEVFGILKDSHLDDSVQIQRKLRGEWK